MSHLPICPGRDQHKLINRSSSRDVYRGRTGILDSNGETRKTYPQESCHGDTQHHRALVGGEPVARHRSAHHPPPGDQGCFQPAGSLQARMAVLDRVLAKLLEEPPTVEEVGDPSVLRDERERQLAERVYPARATS
jgi:hypothetical protein